MVKRFAEIITEGYYSKHTRGACLFSLKISYLDKYGQPQVMPAASWRFDQTLNAKVNWEKIDPRDFASIAIDYEISDDLTPWMSDEPSMSEKKPSDNRQAKIIGRRKLTGVLPMLRAKEVTVNEQIVARFDRCWPLGECAGDIFSSGARKF